MFGGGGNDYLHGDEGDDTIHGEEGNDWMVGGSGADTFDGGAGHDLVSYTDSPSGVLINLMAGKGSGGDAAGDTFTASRASTGPSTTTRCSAATTATR